METRKLQIEHLERRIKLFPPLTSITTPPLGWVKAIRSALGISLQQIAKRLSITKQSVKEIELREQEGTITLNSLREVARSLDMELVYAFVPKDGSLSGLIDRKAREMATTIVQRASNTMKLEDQENSGQRVQRAIEERVSELKNEMPKTLWD
ncbi:MAG: mobile mystery protein A [Bacteroidales bacterium]|jgi:predicted DNA-binding mobile mystery protein A